MSIDLNKKQIFRTISDMVVYSPSDARDIFTIITSHKNSSQFQEIFSLMTFVKDFHDSFNSPKYLIQLRYEIEKIPNEEIRIIFFNSLNSKQND